MEADTGWWMWHMCWLCYRQWPWPWT